MLKAASDVDLCRTPLYRLDKARHDHHPLSIFHVSMGRSRDIVAYYDIGHIPWKAQSGTYGSCNKSIEGMVGRM